MRDVFLELLRSGELDERSVAPKFKSVWLVQGHEGGYAAAFDNYETARNFAIGYENKKKILRAIILAY